MAVNVTEPTLIRSQVIAGEDGDFPFTMRTFWSFRMLSGGPDIEVMVESDVLDSHGYDQSDWDEVYSKLVDAVATIKPSAELPTTNPVVV